MSRRSEVNLRRGLGLGADAVARGAGRRARGVAEGWLVRQPAQQEWKILEHGESPARGGADGHARWKPWRRRQQVP